jgi:hypothetical protein
MKIKVDREGLRKALNIAALAVAKDAGTLPSCVIFRPGATDREIGLSASDGVFLTYVPLGVETVQGRTPFGVEAKRLQAWLGHIVGDDVTLEVLDGNLKATCAKAEAFFVAFDVSGVPDFKAKMSQASEFIVEGPAKPFIEGLKFVRPSIGTETSNNQRANQLQVAEFADGRFFASDSLILSLFDLASHDAYEIAPGVILKMGRDELPRLVKFIGLTCVDTFRAEKTSTFYYVKADDGSIFGYAIPQYSMQSVELTSEVTEPEVWELSVETLRQAMGALKASSAEGNNEVRVLAGPLTVDEDTEVALSMANVTGRKDCTVSLPILCKVPSELGSTEFVLHPEKLLAVLSQFDREVIQVGIQAQGRGVKYMKIVQAVQEISATRTAIVLLKR